MIQRFLRIATISDVKQGKNGPYIVLTFEPNYMLSDGTKIASALSEGTRTVFGPSTIDGKEVKADGLFKGIMSGEYKVGQLVEGQLGRVQTTPYHIPGRERPVTQWTGVVFAHENIHDIVNKNFAREGIGACTLNGDMLTAPDQLSVPPTTNAGEFKPLTEKEGTTTNAVVGEV